MACVSVWGGGWMREVCEEGVQLWVGVKRPSPAVAHPRLFTVVGIRGLPGKARS